MWNSQRPYPFFSRIIETAPYNNNNNNMVNVYNKKSRVMQAAWRFSGLWLREKRDAMRLSLFRTRQFYTTFKGHIYNISVSPRRTLHIPPLDGNRKIYAHARAFPYRYVYNKVVRTNLFKTPMPTLKERKKEREIWRVKKRIGRKREVVERSGQIEKPPHENVHDCPCTVVTYH